jgi:hypothetical protein
MGISAYVDKDKSFVFRGWEEERIGKQYVSMELLRPEEVERGYIAFLET